MPVPIYEEPTGAIDGVNTVFTTSVAYTPGTVQLFQNGQLLTPDCFTETDAGAGTVTLAIAPRTNDVIQLFYLDTSPQPPGTLFQVLDVELRVTRLQGELVEVNQLVGTIAAETTEGMLTTDELSGTAGGDGLSGTLEGA